MKHCILLFSFLLLFCSSTFDNSYEYKCGNRILKGELEKYSINAFKDYNEDDLDLLADITTFINDLNPGKEYECFFNSKGRDLLVLDVFGLEEEQRIDKTLCELTRNREVKLPKRTIILFHKYINGFDDGGIVVGLSMER